METMAPSWATGIPTCRAREHYTLSVCLMHQYYYTVDYKTKAPELGALNNFYEGYEKCDFHKLTGWGNWLNTNTQHLNKNPEKGGGGKME